MYSLGLRLIMYKGIRSGAEHCEAPMPGDQTLRTCVNQVSNKCIALLPRGIVSAVIVSAGLGVTTEVKLPRNAWLARDPSRGAFKGSHCMNCIYAYRYTNICGEDIN